jgi:hypothetical protein
VSLSLEIRKTELFFLLLYNTGSGNNFFIPIREFFAKNKTNFICFATVLPYVSGSNFTFDIYFLKYFCNKWVPSHSFTVPRWGWLVKKNQRSEISCYCPFKGGQGRSNRSSIVHAVSLTPHGFFIFLHTIAVLHMIFTFWNFVCACDINDSACTVHAVSMTLHAF